MIKNLSKAFALIAAAALCACVFTGCACSTDAANDSKDASTQQTQDQSQATEEESESVEGSASNKVEDENADPENYEFVAIEGFDKDSTEYKFFEKVESGFGMACSVYENAEGNPNLKERTKMVHKELDSVEDFADAKFSDKDVEWCADTYIKGLETQLKSLDYYKSNKSKYEKLWQEGYLLKGQAFEKMSEEFGFKVDDFSLEYFEYCIENAKKNS